MTTPTLSLKRMYSGLDAARPFAAVGAPVTWSIADGHIVRPRGLGEPPG